VLKQIKIIFTGFALLIGYSTANSSLKAECDVYQFAMDVQVCLQTYNTSDQHLKLHSCVTGALANCKPAKIKKGCKC
jgi:hypothetical protein